MKVVVKLFLLVALALVVSLGFVIVAHMMALPAAAKTEAARPQLSPGVEVERQPQTFDAVVPCLKVPSGAIRKRFVWVIRAADGTVISAGAIDVRQRC